MKIAAISAVTQGFRAGKAYLFQPAMTWDVEHWSSIDKQRFIRCYSYKGKVLTESTGHNIYDLQNDFKPEEAEKIELS